MCAYICIYIYDVCVYMCVYKYIYIYICVRVPVWPAAALRRRPAADCKHISQYSNTNNSL